MAIHDPIRQRLISASQRSVGFLRSIFRRSRKGRAMGDRTRNRGRSQNGESLVSFALTFPVLFGFLFGIMQVSMAYYTYQWMSETAREGARYAIVHGSTCETSGGASCTSTASAVNSYVSGTGLPNIGGGASTVITTYPDGDEAPGHRVQVSLTYVFPYKIPFMVSKNLSLTSQSVMYIVQ